METRPIVYFDGFCGVCNSVVDFLILRDHPGEPSQRRLLYSTLQGETAKKYLTDRERADLDTVIVTRELANGEIEKFKKSDAILLTLEEIGGAWGALAMTGSFVPRFLRDFVYDIVAKNRFKIMGKKEHCRIPTKEERDLILP